MKGWTPQAAERAAGLQKQPQERTNAAPAPTEPQTREEGRKSKEKEPAEKHASLPPPPGQPGPWQVGSWNVRQTTTYAPASRVVLTGPADEFEQLLAHLKAFKP